MFVFGEGPTTVFYEYPPQRTETDFQNIFRRGWGVLSSGPGFVTAREPRCDILAATFALSFSPR